MSTFQFNTALLTHEHLDGLSFATKFLYQYLASEASKEQAFQNLNGNLDKRIATPVRVSQRDMEKLLGISLKTISNSIKTLEKRNLVRLEGTTKNQLLYVMPLVSKVREYNDSNILVAETSYDWE
ncbi:helix-turn-helix domain-containing protein [Vibrio gallicus]|uniref:hypothetical protein n=1 Tax=Vibrio gallicus TaxID=190897 RepID=UPI0021C49265|nr:hypothetical protein [Vibrio gallicus]